MFGVIKITYISSPNILASHDDSKSSITLKNTVLEKRITSLCCVDISWSSVTYSRINKQFSDLRRNYGTV